MPAKHYKVNLLPKERGELQSLVSTGKAAAYKRTRAQILLKADQGPEGPAWTDQQICAAFDVGRVTVERTRKALVLEGLPVALQRKAREHPPVPRKLDGSGEAQLIALACSEPPAGHSQWTLQLYADQLVQLQIVDTISRDTVRRTLKKRIETLAQEILVYCPERECRFRPCHGGYSRSLSPALRSNSALGLYR